MLMIEIFCFVRGFEAMRWHAHINIREEVTGPILNTLIGYGRPISKRLGSGLTISASYTSKIVRDFLMSSVPEPDHVWEPQTTRTLLELTRGAKQVVIGGAYFGDHA